MTAVAGTQASSNKLAALRWVVAFHGSRDNYQVPIALWESQRLEAFVTDWYSPLDRPWFRLISRLLPRRVRGLLERRYRPALPSTRVKSLVGKAVKQAVLRQASSAIDNDIGRAAGRIAARTGAGILSYNYYAGAAFEAAGDRGHPRVIYQVHPHPGSLRRLFLEEMELVPECRESLSSEVEMHVDAAQLARLSEVQKLADGCMVASNYTRSTLIESGLEPSRIRVVTLGVDAKRFAVGTPSPSFFRVLFVGQMVQRKGLKYLLQAWTSLALPNSELLIIGRGGKDKFLLGRYTGEYRIMTHVSEPKLIEMYGASDVFCMPSIAEGFGQVYLEAMACGTPVIGTRNSGAPDIVTEGENGFVLEIRDVEGLKEKLLWCYENRPQLRQMRLAARAAAERLSWERYRREYIRELEEFAADAVRK